MQKTVKKAILPAAGLGTRFLPATKASPKEMLPIVDKPLIQYAVEEAISCGIEEFIIITGKDKRTIEDHFDVALRLEANLKERGKIKQLEEITKLSNINIAYIRQKEPLGLGHAIMCARPFIKDEPFVVLLSDDLIDPDYPLLQEMIKIYEKTKRPVIAIEEVHRKEVNKYGIIKGIMDKGIYKITDLIEKPSIDKAPSNLAIIGRYVLTTDIFDILEKQKPGKNGEIQLTDAIKKMANSKSIYGYQVQKDKRHDAGEKLGYLKAMVEFAIKDKELSQQFKEYLIEKTNRLI